MSEAYDDGVALLQACAAAGLEGVVSKRRDGTYRSGKTVGKWVKTKTDTLGQAHRDRWRLFQR